MTQLRSAKELIELLNQLGESRNIEAKRGSETGRSIHETISAFSNEPGLGGGYIVLGVEKDKTSLFPAYTATGIKDIEKLKHDLASQCAADTFNVTIRPKMVEEIVDEQPVLVLHIPEAQSHDKPVYIKSVGLPKGAYRRIGESDVRCSDDDLQLLFAGHNQQPYDKHIVQDATIDDLDPAAIDLYRKLRANVNPSAEELNYDDPTLLRALNCTAPDPKTDQLVPTLAGIVVFGKKQALRRLFPLLRVDYLRISGNEWIEDPEERYASIEIRDSLISAALRAEASILDDLPKAFHLPEGSMQRKDRPSIPARVIREAVVNALIHRSYRDQRPIQFRRFANRLELQNPGYSLAAEDRLGEAGSSYARNPTISAIFHDLNLAETKGTGIKTMIGLMEGVNLTPPSFISDRDGDTFTATFLFHHFLSAQDIVWLSGFNQFDLTEGQKKALIYVRETGGINNSAFRTLTKSDTLESSKQLQQLTKLELLEKRAKSSATYYVPGQQFEKYGALAGYRNRTPNENGVQLPSNGVQLPPNTDQLDSNTDQLDSNANQLRQTLPPELLKRVSELGPRARKEKTALVVLALCAIRPYKAEELAGILERKNKKNLVAEVLQPLLEQKKLAYTIAGAPTHPLQKYTTVKGESE